MQNSSSTLILAIYTGKMPPNKHPHNDPDQTPFSMEEWVKFHNAMDEVFFSFDVVNVKLIQVSNGSEKLYGIKSADLLANYKLWLDVVHPDDKHIAVEGNELLAQGIAISKEFRIVIDGQIRWIERKSIPALDANGKLVRIDGIARDITARKLAGEKHRQSKKLYRQIVETAQEGIWSIDEHDRVTFVNPKICQILGYTAEEMLGKTLFDFTDEEGKLHLQACMARRRQGITEKVNSRYITKSGNYVWTEISATPIFEDGVYKGALAMVTDITQKMTDDEAIRNSEANLRTIFDNTDTAYVLFSDDLHIVSFNGLAQKYSQEQNKRDLVVNHNIKDYFTAERWPFVLDVINKVRRHGFFDYELNYKTPDDHIRWHNVRWLIVKDSKNQSRGFILANKNITEAKLAALEREQITTDLIRHNKDLEQFTYIVSHNLRAPVANIMGLADILRLNIDDEALRHEVVEHILGSVKSVDNVIRDLNHILQARKPGNEVKEYVDLKSICEDITASFFNVFQKNNILLECDFSGFSTMYTIRSYIYSVLHNLVSNSIKYRRTDVASLITVKTIQHDKKVEIRFKDNGKGIDMKKNGADIFGLYKRFDTSVEGKGMGLFMVKTQVETLGGTIRIKSEPNKGTEFIMQFSK